jgi:hypothetical protein
LAGAVMLVIGAVQDEEHADKIGMGTVHDAMLGCEYGST